MSLTHHKHPQTTARCATRCAIPRRAGVSVCTLCQRLSPPLAQVFHFRIRTQKSPTGILVGKFPTANLTHKQTSDLVDFMMRFAASRGVLIISTRSDAGDGGLEFCDGDIRPTTLKQARAMAEKEALAIRDAAKVTLHIPVGKYQLSVTEKVSLKTEVLKLAALRLISAFVHDCASPSLGRWLLFQKPLLGAGAIVASAPSISDRIARMTNAERKNELKVRGVRFAASANKSELSSQLQSVFHVPKRNNNWKVTVKLAGRRVEPSSSSSTAPLVPSRATTKLSVLKLSAVLAVSSLAVRQTTYGGAYTISGSFVSEILAPLLPANWNRTDAARDRRHRATARRGPELCLKYALHGWQLHHGIISERGSACSRRRTLI